SVPKGATGEERLTALGLTLLDTGEKIEFDGEESPKILIDNVEIDSPAAKAGLNWDQTILDVSLPQVSLPKEWMFIPGLLLAFGIAWNQRRRRNKI
ncbi:MAG TPA: C4-dicarboxylate ABC transporter, partial [Pasteurellaceae bacterium]|nr:C4-dicarboxylate ABC transporter [Pasteurellaceae bacterium]